MTTAGQGLSRRLPTSVGERIMVGSQNASSQGPIFCALWSMKQEAGSVISWIMVT